MGRPRKNPEGEIPSEEIKVDGNVGGGTTTPTEKLEVTPKPEEVKPLPEKKDTVTPPCIYDTHEVFLASVV